MRSTAVTTSPRRTGASRRLAAAASFGLVAVLLAGCTGSAEPEPTDTSSASSSASADANATSTPTPSPEPSDVNDDAEGAVGTCTFIEPRSNDHDDRVGGYVIRSIVDNGVIEHATGEAQFNEDGSPRSYTVAKGDTAYAIASRFCIDYVEYLGWINSVRRNGVENLYAGDTLNLDRFRITSIGDENGVVYENSPSVDHIPPQKD